MMQSFPSSLRWHDSSLLFLPWLLCLLSGGYLLVRSAVPDAATPPEPMESEARYWGVTLVSPGANLHFLARESSAAGVRFVWKTTAPAISGHRLAPSARLDVSSDPAFPEPTTETRIVLSDHRPEAVLQLPQGHYYWRVRLGKHVVSERNELWVDLDRSASREIPRPRAAPAIVAPPPMTAPLTLELQTAPEGEPWYEDDPGLHLDWFVGGLSPAKMQFRVEISRDPSFVRGVSVARTRERTLKLSRLKLRPGAYFWRVRGESETGKTLILSASAPFRLLGAPLPLPPKSSVEVNSSDSSAADVEIPLLEDESPSSRPTFP